MLEAKNSERVLDNFRKLSPHIANFVYAPKVYWNLSTSKLLIMEFMDGAQVNDVKAIRKLGIQPNEVARLVSLSYKPDTFCLFIIMIGEKLACLTLRMNDYCVTRDPLEYKHV